jgi:hypothetical protein
MWSTQLVPNHRKPVVLKGRTCGTSPLGKGMPIIPATKLVQPRRKEVPMKTTGFLERKLLCLSSETADVLRGQVSSHNGTFAGF